MREEVIYCKSPNYPRPDKPGNLDKVYGGDNMVLDNGRVYVETQKCEKCENANICRWCDDMKEARGYVNNEPNAKCLSPIKIRITCDSFKKKSERQDGWYKTGQRN